MTRFVEINGNQINTDEIIRIYEIESCHLTGSAYHNAGIGIVFKNSTTLKLYANSSLYKLEEIEIDNWIDSIKGNNERKVAREQKQGALNEYLAKIEKEERCNYCMSWGYYKKSQFRCSNCDNTIVLNEVNN